MGRLALTLQGDFTIMFHKFIFTSVKSFSAYINAQRIKMYVISWC